jgi:undecaprenyl-diphosphatase
MDVFIAILLGIVQGLTEWFPVSSSGHLIVIQHILVPGELPFSYTISLHAATLLVLIIFFRRDIIHAGKGIIDVIIDVIRGKRLNDSIRKDENRVLGVMVIVAMIPTGILGLLIYTYITEKYIQTLLPVGIAFIIQGLLVLSTKFGRKKRTISEITLRDSLAIGTMQGLSAFSGLSRSGSTISTGVALGIDRRSAARFSFIASIPAFIAALILDLRDITGFGSIDPVLLAAGFIPAFLVGLASLKGLMFILRGTRFYLFSIYSFIFGCVVLTLYSLGY